MYNYKLLLSYDGTAYGGWQIQPNAVTIQELLQEKMAILLKENVWVIGSGRTDAGVHALGQTAHFHFGGEIDLYRFQWSLNALLPSDVRVRAIEQVPHAFHAQYSAIGKCYHYHLQLERVNNPFQRLYRLHVQERISTQLLKEAGSCFLGTHDFMSFANEAHKGTAAHDSIRTVKRLDVVEQEGGVRIEIEADGFLYKMVRNIVGTLLEISAGHRSITEIPLILTAKDRRKAGKTAPPHGLFLQEVFY